MSSTKCAVEAMEEVFLEGDRSSLIAPSSMNLVDRTKIIEVENLDFDNLPKKRLYAFSKRLLDVVLGSIASVVCAIPMIIIAILVKADSPGPVFFRQERLGLNGRPFILVKFRTMAMDAENDGAQWAQDEDPRVTRLGRKLRESRLDELPQFWGVVKGDLSLIGPRPERRIFHDEFEKYIHGFSQRLLVPPGISGLAQVRGGYNLLPEEKIIYDLEYIKNRSLLLDVKIMLETLVVVLSTHDGAR